jgi:hypothetical protein
MALKLLLLLSSYNCFSQIIATFLKLFMFFQAMANFLKPFQTLSSLLKFMATSKRNMKHHISKNEAPLESQNVEIHDIKINGIGWKTYLFFGLFVV